MKNLILAFVCLLFTFSVHAIDKPTLEDKAYVIGCADTVLFYQTKLGQPVPPHHAISYCIKVREAGLRAIKDKKNPSNGSSKRRFQQVSK